MIEWIPFQPVWPVLNNSIGSIRKKINGHLSSISHVFTLRILFFERDLFEMIIITRQIELKINRWLRMASTITILSNPLSRIIIRPFSCRFYQWRIFLRITNDLPEASMSRGKNKTSTHDDENISFVFYRGNSLERNEWKIRSIGKISIDRCRINQIYGFSICFSSSLRLLLQINLHRSSTI